MKIAMIHVEKEDSKQLRNSAISQFYPSSYPFYKWIRKSKGPVEVLGETFWELGYKFSYHVITASNKDLCLLADLADSWNGTPVNPWSSPIVMSCIYNDEPAKLYVCAFNNRLC